MGRQRVEPGPGQESVWDYPRPPRMEDVEEKVKVVFGDVTLAYTARAKRVLETSHPPVYYDVVAEDRAEERAAWFYPSPTPSFRDLEDYVAFYPSRMDACWVGGEKVEAQEGDFYGGWITRNIVGPFKGSPGTWGW